MSVQKCRKITSDGITDKAFLLEGYSKWKDIDLVTNEELSIIIYSQVQLINYRTCMYTVTDLLCRSTWKVG